MPDPRVARLALAKLASEKLTRPADSLVEAAGCMLDGAPERAGRIIADIDVDAVEAFARRLVAAEQQIANEAWQVLESAVETSGAPRAAPTKAATKGATNPAKASANSTSTSLLGARVWAEKPLAAEFLRAKSILPAALNGSVASVAAPPAVRAAVDLSLRRRGFTLDELARYAKTEPLGYLYLERMRFTPVAYHRGDLMYSITLTPGEIVRVTHREWSRTEREFATLVSTSTETQQDDELSEKSELSETSSNENSHNMAFSASATASGSYGTFSFSANAGLNISDSRTNATQETKRRSRELTRKASSRAKQEHKVSFKVTTTVESEDTSYRELQNTSSDAQRWDFHRIVREWRVDVYRYDARLTYELTVPEPGSYLLREYLELEHAEAALLAPPDDPPTLEDIQPENWNQLCVDWKLVLPRPPEARVVEAPATLKAPENNGVGAAGVLELLLPEGYEVQRDEDIEVDVLEAPFTRSDSGLPVEYASRTDMREPENRARLVGWDSGLFAWMYQIVWFNSPHQGEAAQIKVSVRAVPGEGMIAAWRAKVIEVITEALKNRQQDAAAAAEAKRAAISARLASATDLDLRRIEREEIMKSVLRWLLGPTFDFRVDAGRHSGIDEAHAEADSLYTEFGSVANDEVWFDTLRHGRLVAFLHEAIEWENTNFVVYPYFWSDPLRWDLKQRLVHPDPLHWQFLRAGAARVVLTIRPGFEEAWLHFTQAGLAALGATAPPDAPYLSVVNELKSAADTYRPYTIDPNAPHGDLVDSWSEYMPLGALDVVGNQPLAP